MKPDYRLVVGLGSGSVFETSLTLHHIHGFPYIPATALKGAVRNYLISTVFYENVDRFETEFPEINSEYRAYQNEGFCKIFGCPSTIEKVEFELGKPKKNK